MHTLESKDLVLDPAPTPIGTVRCLGSSASTTLTGVAIHLAGPYRGECWHLINVLFWKSTLYCLQPRFLLTLPKLSRLPTAHPFLCPACLCFLVLPCQTPTPWKPSSGNPSLGYPSCCCSNHSPPRRTSWPPAEHCPLTAAQVVLRSVWLFNLGQ